MNTKRIGVIGIGRLGLAFALLCEQSGYEVMGCDTRTGYVQDLNAKTYRTVEPQIEQMLQDSKNFRATISMTDTVEFADILFVLVPTPSLPDGSYNHQHIEHVVKDIEKLEESGVSMKEKILVISCTTMPGYTQTICDRLKPLGMSVVYNPEFIVQGDIIKGLRTADMILMGYNNEDVFNTIEDVYIAIMDKEPHINSMSPTAAEIVKIATNCFLTTKIAFANMVGEIVINSGIESEVSTVLQAIGDDSRIGQKFLKYGYPFSGVCLPRDNRALGLHANKVKLGNHLNLCVDGINQEHGNFLKDYFIQQNPDKKNPFLFTQLSYKKGVDILTESAPYKLCQELLKEGYRVDITESDVIIKQVQEEFEIYGDRVTYGTCKEGYLIDL